MVQYARGAPAQQANALSQPAYAPRLLIVRAAIDGLETPIIPFAIFKSDPRAAFQQHVAVHAQQSQGTSDSSSVLYDAWNISFASLDCKKLFFLLAWSSVPAASPRVVQVAELKVGVATPGPFRKRWLVTCALKRLDAPVAWCVEVDMTSKPGRERVDEIVLGEGNMIRLVD